MVTVEKLQEAAKDMLVNIVLLDPAAVNLSELPNESIAYLHDSLRSIRIKLTEAEKTTYAKGWFSFGIGSDFTSKARRSEIERRIRDLAENARREHTHHEVARIRQERERPERELREALAGADAQLLRVMHTALQQFVDNGGETGEVKETWISDTERAGELIGKFDAFFAAQAE